MRSVQLLTAFLLFIPLWLIACSSVNLPPPTAVSSGVLKVANPTLTATPTQPATATAAKPPTPKTPTPNTLPEVTASPTITTTPETTGCTVFPTTGVLVQNGSRYTILEPQTGDRCQIKPIGRMEAPRLAAGQLYYVRFDEDSNSRSVWKTSADGSSQKLAFTSQLAADAFILDFLVSEDGRRIAWTAVTGTVDAAGDQQVTSDLWLADIDGRAPVQLLDEYGFNDNRRVLPLRFSHDGSHLYFALQPIGLGGVWTSYTGRYDSFYELALAEGEPTPLFDCQEQALYICLGDFRIEEQLLAYTDVPNKRISVITWQGAVISNYTPAAESFFGFPTFGPDGELVLYAAAVADDDLFARPGILSLARPDTAETTSLLEQEGLMPPLIWLDSRHILTLHAGSGLGGMAVVATDGTVFPLVLEVGDYVQYLGQ